VRQVVFVVLYLVACDSQEDVVIVDAAPAQDVHALLIALLTQLVGGVVHAGGGGAKLHNGKRSGSTQLYTSIAVLLYH
jgi:hypothetical protein